MSLSHTNVLCCFLNICLIDAVTPQEGIRISRCPSLRRPRCRAHSRRNSLRRVPKGKLIAATLIFRTCRDREGCVHSVTLDFERGFVACRSLVALSIAHFLWRRKQFIIFGFSSPFARRRSHISNPPSSIHLYYILLTVLLSRGDNFLIL